MVWYGMLLDVRLYVHTCAVCNKNKKRNRTPRTGQMSYTAGCPGERVHLDILGPFNESSKGNRYLLVIVDQFTRWVEIYPLPDQSAEKMAKVFFDNYVARFGVPLQIHTDQGRNFCGNFFQVFCELLEITKTRTTPYRPSSNGQVERYNRTILQFIRCFLEGKVREWDQYITHLGLALRSMVNVDTGFTPNMLMLGHEVNLPVDVFFGVSHANRTGREPAEFLRELLPRLEETFRAARENIRGVQVRQKRRYDIKLQVNKFSRGDFVYKLDSASVVGQSRKLRSVYVGPFLVVEVISPVLYRVEDQKRSMVLHHDRLALCEDRCIPFWVRRKRHQLLELDETLAYEEDDSVLPDEPDGDGELPVPGSSAGEGGEGLDGQERVRESSVEAAGQSEPDGEDDLGLSSLFGSEPQVTRSGRRVVPPAHLSDYM